MSFDSEAQSDPVTLSAFSKARSAHFSRQLQGAKDYVRSHNKPLFFMDDKGNRIHMVGITPSGLPIYWSTLNADAAVTTNVVALRSGGTLGLNLLGEGMMTGVWDGGRVKDHAELGQRVIAKEGTTDDNHATHVTGTLIASGINPLARGMAPLANASTHDFLDDEAEMAALAQTNQSSLLFSNHSYGTVTGWLKNGATWEWTGDSGINPIEDYRFGFYDTRAQAIDQIAWLAPYYSIVWAAGNDRADAGDGSRPADCNGGAGYDCIIPEGVAKNIITVGAVNKVLAYSNPFDVTMSFFSSWGPTDDGRIKPDLVGDGVNLFSLSSNGTDTYTSLSGTSMATPNVTGSLLLLQELYGKLHGGDFMKAATVKALAIHTAKEAGSFPGPDYSFGWGLLDAGAAAATLVSQDDQAIFVKELSLKNDSLFRWVLHPKANQRITATIAWTDPPGNPSAPSVDPANLMLVNDLDLRIVDELGSEQLPWTLDPANPTRQATRGDNFRDNVEKIEFDLPEGKAYTLVVRHKGNLVTPRQDFSLILSYQPLQSPRTFYWVGDSGNWSDGAHWALTSNGTSTMTGPGPADRVIVDDNSFDGVGTDGISLTQNTQCASVLWLNSTSAGISFQGNTLSVDAQFIFGDSAFTVQTPGQIHLQPGSSPGRFIANGNTLTGLALFVDGGDWTSQGDFAADDLLITSGTLTVSKSVITLDRFTSAPAPGWVSVLHLDHTTLNLNQSSTLDGNRVTISSDHSVLAASSSGVSLHWQSVNFPGEIRIPPSAVVSIDGDNHLGKIDNEGIFQAMGSNTIDTLVVMAGAEIDLGQSTVQMLSAQTQLLGNSTHAATLSSSTHASLKFPDHVKLCFNYLAVDNIDITGVAKVNAGLNSVLSNAANWQQVADCADVLFADFEFKYNCAHASTEFTNTSSGKITDYSWRFENSQAVIHDMNPAQKFDTPGSYEVTLTVTGNGGTDSVTKAVQIVPNPLMTNTIVYNGSTLTSFLIGSQYQWFKDGAVISGATNRSYPLDGSEGVYYVVSYEGQCNSISDPMTITGLSDDTAGIEIHPNPASEYLVLRIAGSSSGSLGLTDVLGKTYSEKTIDQAETVLSLEAVPNGIYVLQITLPNKKARRRIVVLH